MLPGNLEMPTSPGGGGRVLGSSTLIVWDRKLTVSDKRWMEFPKWKNPGEKVRQKRGTKTALGTERCEGIDAVYSQRPSLSFSPWHIRRGRPLWVVSSGNLRYNRTSLLGAYVFAC